MGIQVLIVDDSATTRCVIERTVRLSDPEITDFHHAANGKLALEILRKNWIDLVFADLHMPEVNGRELIKTMRENEVWRGIPVAVVTSEQADDTEIELMELGANCIQKKPLTPEVIREILAVLREKML